MIKTGKKEKQVESNLSGQILPLCSCESTDNIQSSETSKTVAEKHRPLTSEQLI